MLPSLVLCGAVILTIRSGAPIEPLLLSLDKSQTTKISGCTTVVSFLADSIGSLTSKGPKIVQQSFPAKFFKKDIIELYNIVC